MMRGDQGAADPELVAIQLVDVSDKLNKPLLGEIRKVKNDRFREYLAARYNERSTVTALVTNAAADGQPEIPRHKHGAYGWVRLSDDEYARLLDDLGEEELTRCIDYHGRVCSNATATRTSGATGILLFGSAAVNAGASVSNGNGSRPSASGSAMDDLQQLHQMYASEESL
ncbi:MAG: hypothetical protein ACLU9S_23260 [Oscillospiraceae bacterium]